ncbi:hypothetical protein Tco_1310158 [Tanacetum coccineum]
MANSLPPNHADDLPELAPTMPKPVPFAPENVLFNEDEDPEEDPEEEPQEEEEFEGDEFEDEMDMDFDDEIDDPEVIHPYKVEGRFHFATHLIESRCSSDMMHGLSFIALTADDYVEFTHGYTNLDVNSLHR